MATHRPTSTYRTIFISDLHLGTKEARAEAALEFIARHRCEYLYLVGDIFDGWALRRSWYWSFSSFLKYKTKRAVQYIAKFEDLVTEKATREEVDGVVCGHIHHPEISRVGDILYANTGDWVESCTALVEHHDGTLELLRAQRDRHGPTPGTAHLQGDGARTEPVIEEKETTLSVI